ncbi:MarR family winged helix-turn-helix transcriptional regulator [Nocardioides sp. Kera G14]|uniref:MarR family winged helix-turn-helix transcriptional regulator n=1 Tax=Nocardioides sp. Kera G14 TaxID=2884264 RepID=UPI001D10123F|nr:MarR family transcriptional regulator [Nocardioides sp. Kera G14]UDY23992.1 MarR family transcriptional regulator [Nocardioides sp. Kera G14]
MTSRAEGLRLVETEISNLVRRVRRIIGERAAAVHPELQGVSYLILGWLEQNGPARASSIVEAFRIDKGALSRQLHHLEELGLVVRTPDPGDGRASLVELTDEARLRMSQVDSEQRKLVDERLGGWTATELRDLANQLKRYNDALD